MENLSKNLGTSQPQYKDCIENLDTIEPRHEVERCLIEAQLSANPLNKIEELVASGALTDVVAREVAHAAISIHGRGEEVGYLAIKTELVRMNASELTREKFNRFDLRPSDKPEDQPEHWAKKLIAYAEQDPPKQEESEAPDPWSLLEAQSITSEDKLKEREESAKDAVFVMASIALLGQITIIFMRYNGGKTLLALWMLCQSIKAGRIKGSDVMYVNADDSFEGATTKARIAMEHEIRMVVPGSDGAMTVEQITSAIAYMGAHGQAKGRIFVLDTLKKFVDTMGKSEAREFLTKLRAFTQAGGTIIALAHTNKNKDSDGKSIAEGVGDFASDCDCLYIGEIDTPLDEPKRQVTLRNEKLRGPVKQKVSFTYDAGEGKCWIDRFHSVEQLGAKEAEQNVAALLANEQRKKDQHVIDYIVGQLTELGPQSKTALIENNLNGETGSKAERKAVIERYGPRAIIPEFKLWGESKNKAKGWSCYLLEEDERNQP
jgi:hypothetical protein